MDNLSFPEFNPNKTFKEVDEALKAVIGMILNDEAIAEETQLEQLEAVGRLQNVAKKWWRKNKRGDICK